MEEQDTVELAVSDASVFGLSTQDSACQREAVDRLHLPFALLSDEQMLLTRALRASPAQPDLRAAPATRAGWTRRQATRSSLPIATRSLREG